MFRYQGGQFVLLLVGGIFLAVGSVLTVAFNQGLPADIAIATGGEIVNGRVVELAPDPSLIVNGRQATRIRFTYHVGGERFEGAVSTVNDETIAAANHGRVDVEVSPGNPQWARPRGTTYSDFGYFGLFALIFPLLGVGLVFAAVRSNRREIRAFVHGEPAVARVVYRGLDLSTKINGRHPYKVGWQFSVFDRTYTGGLSTTSPEIEELGRGDEVIVLFDRADPRVNTLWIA